MGSARTDTIAAVAATHGSQSGPELEAATPETTTAGRVVSIRSFGKANFLVISGGDARIQVYVRMDFGIGA